MTAAHEQTDVVVPFTDKDQSEMRGEDVKAAKAIGFLCSGIFSTGVLLYISVMIWVWSQAPIYSVR